jgi:hypothetical protein
MAKLIKSETGFQSFKGEYEINTENCWDGQYVRLPKIVFPEISQNL